MKLTVNLGKTAIRFILKTTFWTNARAYISLLLFRKKIMIISDDNVFPLYGEQLKTSSVTMKYTSWSFHTENLQKAFETPAL